MNTTEMAELVTARIERILDVLPDDRITEKYEASALRDYTQTLINLERLKKGAETWLGYSE